MLSHMDFESSLELLEKTRAGDDSAKERLLARYRPRIYRWASGRIPNYARDFTDTEDLVQLAMMGLVKNLDAFDYRGEWALQAYLRRTVLNEVRKQIRRQQRVPHVEAISEELETSDLCPYEAAVGREVFERYNRALERLTPLEQEAVVAWVEMGCSHREIMVLTEKSSVDAARMFVTRALEKLAKEMASMVGS